MREAVERLQLDLRGLAVLTEAASGAYACTPVLAAMAGARWVYAYARDTRLWQLRRPGPANPGAGARRRCRGPGGDSDPPAAWASPSRPRSSPTAAACARSTAELIGRLPAEAVVALMYEAWEFRPSDVDLAACLARQIPIVALNERHPTVGVFPYLGVLAVRELHDAGFAVHGCRIGVLCDNALRPHICRTLESVGRPCARPPDPRRIAGRELRRDSGRFGASVATGGGRRLGIADWSRGTVQSRWSSSGATSTARRWRASVYRYGRRTPRRPDTWASSSRPWAPRP